MKWLLLAGIIASVVWFSRRHEALDAAKRRLRSQRDGNAPPP